ncbi:MAG: YfhO family protein [Planctomycetaceae bacterium]|nr:YfhO family protein [Planctomycetaceae bacterium]
MSQSRDDALAWRPERRPWGVGDLVATLVWTGAIVAFFWDAVSLRRSLFYFDITEINYPYRDFFARELRAGRFSRWCPGLSCGLPLFSESQAGYLHPLKYLLYPWLPTWQALNLDTVLSVWLTGLGTFGWLRRHVGPSGALTGAAVFGLSGFVWAHLIHTSMTNALVSVPFVFWSLEVAWDRGRWWPIVPGALALACQVFAGHLQDTILTSGAVGLYGLARAATERGRDARLAAAGMTAGLVVLGMLLAAVQWVPSKELLDRSPRASGLSWNELTYGSWHPELLPTLVVREAYGTRARDTDWMDGFYPYHEMNAYIGAIAMALAIVGASAYRDRWVASWIALAIVGGLLMLGRFTILFDQMHRIPVVGSSRIPVRYHLWVALATSALAALGVDRLARPGPVRLRAATLTILAIVVASLPLMLWVYAPLLRQSSRWTVPYIGWLGRELIVASARTAVLALLAWAVAFAASRTAGPARRARLAALLPVLVIADLLGAHIADNPTIDPSYWTDPPPTALRIKADPTAERVLGVARKSSAEPGYASTAIDFFSVRDTLDWGLPLIWGLKTARQVSPLYSLRLYHYGRRASPGQGRLDIEGVTHVVTGLRPEPGSGDWRRVGRAFLKRNPGALPRARLMGRPFYAEDERAAMAAFDRLGPALRERLVVEDPDRPLPERANPSGTATIVREVPERLEVATDATSPAYLILSDTFDPGWSATLDGRPVPIRPAYIAFRAVFVPQGRHLVVFTYRPAGFLTGLAVTGLGLALATGMVLWPHRVVTLAPDHAGPPWPRRWPLWALAAVVTILLASIVAVRPPGRLAIQSRWSGSFHPFTWRAGIEAIGLFEPDRPIP